MSCVVYHMSGAPCGLTSALCRAVGGAQRRGASVGHQRAVRRHRESPETAWPNDATRRRQLHRQQLQTKNCSKAQQACRLSAIDLMAHERMCVSKIESGCT